jgi:transcriptional regulator with XRE-family HTH domain
MSINKTRSSPKFERSYERAALRSAFVSLLWAVFTYRKKKEGLTLQALAKSIPANKAEVSRWFKGDPNWTVNTIASIANALNVDIRIEAIDRQSNAVFTPAGLQTSASVEFIRTEPTVDVAKTRPANPIIRKLPHGATVVDAFADAA